jgi:hypothetical protein
MSDHHTKEHVDFAMGHASASVVLRALTSPHHTKEHVDFAMGHSVSDVVAAALHSPHATKEQITDVMNRWDDTWIGDLAKYQLRKKKYNKSPQP